MQHKGDNRWSAQQKKKVLRFFLDNQNRKGTKNILSMIRIADTLSHPSTSLTSTNGSQSDHKTIE